jgi:hypothetical protein
MDRHTLAPLVALALLVASPSALAQGAPPPAPPAGAAPATGSPSGLPTPPPPPPGTGQAQPAPSSTGAAQTPPPPPPASGGYGVPPGYYPPQGGAYGAPPPGYYPPPGGYGVTPGYVPYPPPGSYGPSRLPYAEDDTIPVGYEVATRPRKGLLVGGVATAASTYGLSLLFAATFGGSGSSEFVPLYIPVVGPFITIGTADASGAGLAMLMLDGLSQAAGVAMIIGAIAAPEKYLRRKVAMQPEVLVGGRSAALRWRF